MGLPELVGMMCFGKLIVHTLVFTALMPEPKLHEKSLRTALPAKRQADELLLEFVNDRDVPCPRCGYNLRALTRTVCPECEEDLVLAVGLKKLHFGWFLATIIPGIFSGFCAVFMTAIIVWQHLRFGGFGPWYLYAIVGFGWISGILAAIVITLRLRFLRFSTSSQQLWAIITWSIHLLIFSFLMWLILG